MEKQTAITIFIIASLLPHLLMKRFTKGPTFWTLTLHNEGGLIRRTFACCQVSVSLKGSSGDVHIGVWSFFQEGLDAPTGTSSGTHGDPQNPAFNALIRSSCHQPPHVLKCEGGATDALLKGVRAAGRKTEKERAELITSGFRGPRWDSRNVYELDLSVVNQVMAEGEAVMNLTLIGRGWRFNNNISVRRINVLREAPTSLGRCNPFSNHNTVVNTRK